MRNKTLEVPFGDVAFPQLLSDEAASSDLPLLGKKREADLVRDI